LDNLTHSLFAVTLARTPLSRAGRGTTAALLIASNGPDIDILATAGGAVNYLSWHRGLTHGPIGIVGLGLISAGLVWGGRRMLDRRRGVNFSETDAPFWMLAAVAIIGVLLHVLMDLPTSYGTRLLAPFTWRWFGADLLPIVDIYLLIALAAGLLFGRRSAEARRRNATIVLAVMAANYGLRAAAHHQALELVPRVFGPTLPQPCDPPPQATWPIDSWPRATPSPPPPGKRCLIEAVALPSFTSPFNWRIILQLSNAYEVRDIDILDPRLRDDADPSAVPWRVTTRYPNIWAPPVQRAAATHLGQVFLGFSRLPAARSTTDRDGGTTVRFTDMRFAAGPVSIDQPVSRAAPFTATVRMAPDGAVLQETLGR